MIALDTEQSRLKQAFSVHRNCVKRAHPQRVHFDGIQKLHPKWTIATKQCAVRQLRHFDESRLPVPILTS